MLNSSDYAKNYASTIGKSLAKRRDIPKIERGRESCKYMNWFEGDTQDS